MCVTPLLRGNTFHLRQCPHQLHYPVGQKIVRVPNRSLAEYRCRVQRNHQLLLATQEPQLLRLLYRSQEYLLLLLVDYQLRPELLQSALRARTLVYPYPQRHLPAKVKTRAVYRLLVRDPVMRLQQKHLRQHRRRHACPAVVGTIE